MGRVRWRRVLAVGFGVLALLVGSGVIAYRVFAANESLTAPTVGYPESTVITDERPFSELRAAPLVVDGRLRVYAEKWRVWSDAPVGERYETTPYWALRRWPAQVVGVVATQTARGPVVVTQWSDGDIVALDARRGAIAWRTMVPIGEHAYDGRRTGASVVYTPASLLTVRTADRAVVTVTGPGAVVALDAASGKEIWRYQLPAGCVPAAWSGAGLLVVPDCSAPAIIHLVNASTGSEQGTWTSPQPARPPRPALCELSRSECRLVVVHYQTWSLGGDASLDPVPELEVGAQLTGERIVYQTGTGVAARRLTDTSPLWTWIGHAQLIAADSAGVYLITEDRTVLELSPATGHLVAVGCASSAPNEDWQLGHVYPTGVNYLVLERITNAPPTADDQQYFYGPRPVALVELYTPTKLPVWPGKFAACRPVQTPR